jgi:two-component system response regulator HupR/HoxA
VRVLVVDDEPIIRATAFRILTRDPRLSRLFMVGSAAEARKVLERELVDVVLCDDQMPGERGRDFLEFVRERWPEVRRLLHTGDFAQEGVPGVVVKVLVSGQELADLVLSPG